MEIFTTALKHILHWGIKYILLFSSMYFSALLVMTIFLPQYASIIGLVFCCVIFLLLLFLILDKFVKNLFTERNISLVGSVSFVIFILSKYLFEQNIFAEIFALHQDTIEYLFNYSLAVIILHAFTIIIIFIIIPIIFFNFIGFLKKFSKNKIYQEFIEALALPFVVIMIFVFGWYKEGSEWLDGNIESAAPKIISVVGFSLFYIHLDFLVKRLLEYIGYSSNTTRL